ncbi:MAG: EVE domain-containing protein [Bacteroidetes bacterium]|nr:EVE domain-containing protein [Bacteroidota bacterium]
MNYWLIKSEPSTYSIDNLKAEKQTFWSGVRNYAARNNMQAMKKGDICLFYHSVTDPAVVGLAKVVKESYQDPTTDEPAWVVVDVQFVKKFKTPITLQQIKQDKKLANMDLLRLSRLSVQSVKRDEYEHILKLAGE